MIDPGTSGSGHPVGRPSGCLPALVVVPLRAARALAGGAPRGRTIGRGVALRGRIWNGIADIPFDGVVVVDAEGMVAAVGPPGGADLPEGLRLIDCAWIGPGVIDAHVHLSTTAASGDEDLRFGVVAVRDLGAPIETLGNWRSMAPIRVAGAGPWLVGASVDAGTVPAQEDDGGRQGRARRRRSARSGNSGQSDNSGQSENSRRAGTCLDGLGRVGSAVVDSPATARALVAGLAAAGVDLVKVCIEGRDDDDDSSRSSRSSRRPRMRDAELAALVDAAHAAGLPVTAHALTVSAVRIALRMEVDELAHVPLEPLPPRVVDEVAAAGIPVVSTLQRHAGVGPAPGRNAALLHRAGVPLIYGTGAGGIATRQPGVDPRELDRLAYAGLGRLGALRAATSGSARAAGFDGRWPSGRIERNACAAVVGLPADPLVEPAAWRHPLVVVLGNRLVTA